MGKEGGVGGASFSAEGKTPRVAQACRTATSCSGQHTGGPDGERRPLESTLPACRKEQPPCARTLSTS